MVKSKDTNKDVHKSMQEELIENNDATEDTQENKNNNLQEELVEKKQTHKNFEYSSSKHKFSNEPVFVLRPLITNAFFPIFIKNFIIALLLSGILFGISMILEFFNISFMPVAWSVIAFVILALILALIPLITKIFRLSFTKYIFYESSVVYEFRFIILKRHSAIYQRITNVSVDINIWDRICRAGDITLHTDDEDPDIVLQYIKHPEEIEHKIYSLIKKQNSSVQEN